ncbi:MAG TPA: hypothetical protein VKI99_21030 [Candidatus Dormibacteraeota bacterium]|nr:hypothetical protein [Candidatus Dormibacteraeota bacterium]
MATTLRARAEIPVEDTWDVESVFHNDAGWSAERARVLAALPELERFRGRLGEGPEVLADFLAASERVSRALDRVVVYATMRSSVDAADEVAAALADQARGLGARVQAALAFVQPELLAVGPDVLRRWVGEHQPLAIYAHWVDRLASQAPHVRSAEVEEVLGQASEPLESAASVHGVLTNADLRFAPAVASDGTEYEVAHGVYQELLSSADRQLRRSAWESYADAHLAAARTMAACLATGMKRDVFLARARGYHDSLDAALTPAHIPRRGLPQRDRRVPRQRGHLAALLALAAPGAGPRLAARVRRPGAAGAPRGSRLSAGRGLDIRGHGAAGRGLRPGPAAGSPARALGRRVPQPG